MGIPQKCTAEVTAVRALTHDVKEISLTLIDPPHLPFTAGQYIAIEVTEDHDGHPRLNNRPYSIASSPAEQGVIRLCANRVGSGPGSTYLHSLKPSDAVLFLPPMGFFTVKAPETASLLFVATGTGIAPIKAMISHLLMPEGTPSISSRPITLYWGLRREEDLYYQEELAEWASRHSSFRFLTTLSKPSPAWQGMRGRVTDHLPHIPLGAENDLDTYLCGNGEMIKAVRAILLDRGVPKQRIHFEKFY